MENGQDKRVVAIIGARGGIGKALVSTYLDDDVELLLTANSRYDELAAWAKDLEPERGASVRTFRADLSSQKGAERLAEELLTTPRIDSLVVASGIDLMTPANKALDFDARLARAWQIDVASTITLARAIGVAMASRSRSVPGGGASPGVVLFGWDGAFRGQEGETAQIYSTCKGAVVAFARSLAQELAPYVRVNTVSPGWIKTTWGEQASPTANQRAADESLAGRWGTAEEVARVVRFLLSDDASFLNGQDIQVNGGFSFLRRS